MIVRFDVQPSDRVAQRITGALGTISRQLAYLDAQVGRPKDFAGGRRDRNVTLYRE